MNAARQNAGGMSQGRSPAAGGAGRQMTPGGSRGMAGGAGRGPAGGPGHGGMGQPGGAPRPAGMRRRPPHPPILPFGMRQVPGMRMMGYDESYRVLMALEALMGGRFDPAHIRLVERFFGRQFAPHEYADLYYWMRDYMRMW
ncbi:MAG: hypothetical protein LUH00_07055 [Lachnospiraceae bacterium]|nr:hypothetical protein [Lachnospiraceae bacterium]